MPVHLKTVPSCKQCERAFDKDIAYFRLTIISMIPPGASEAVDKITAVAFRSLAKDRREKEKFDRSVRLRPTYSAAGIVTGLELYRELDTPRFHSIAEKIIRALFYLKNKRILPKDYSVRICVDNRWLAMPEFEGEFLPTMCEPESFGDSLFQVRSVRDEGDPNVTAWMLYFYQQIGIFGLTCRCDDKRFAGSRFHFPFVISDARSRRS